MWSVKSLISYNYPQPGVSEYDVSLYLLCRATLTVREKFGSNQELLYLMIQAFILVMNTRILAIASALSLNTFKMQWSVFLGLDWQLIPDIEKSRIFYCYLFTFTFSCLLMRCAILHPTLLINLALFKKKREWAWWSLVVLY